jgi:hypothetical protein
VQDQFLYGADLLVAPVIEEGAPPARVILPGDTPWRHCLVGARYLNPARMHCCANRPAARLLPPGTVTLLRCSPDWKECGRMSERSNISDVAARAGVAVKTVSRVLNGHPYVSAETRERVEEAMKALDFRPPSPRASCLARNRTRLR